MHSCIIQLKLSKIDFYNQSQMIYSHLLLVNEFTNEIYKFLPLNLDWTGLCWNNEPADDNPNQQVTACAWILYT